MFSWCGIWWFVGRCCWKLQRSEAAGCWLYEENPGNLYFVILPPRNMCTDVWLRKPWLHAEKYDGIFVCHRFIRYLFCAKAFYICVSYWHDFSAKQQFLTSFLFFVRLKTNWKVESNMVEWTNLVKIMNFFLIFGWILLCMFNTVSKYGGSVSLSSVIGKA